MRPANETEELLPLQFSEEEDADLFEDFNASDLFGEECSDQSEDLFNGWTANAQHSN